MSTFDTKEDLLVTIQTILDSINSGNLNQEEMEVFVSSTRELYERALILRYKAYEQKIYEQTAPINASVENEEEEKIVVTPLIESIEEPLNTTPFDMSFSLFDQEEITEPTSKASENQITEIVVETSIIEHTHQEEELEIEVESTPFFVESIVSAPDNSELKEEISVPQTHAEPKDSFDKMLAKDNSLGAKLTSTRIDSLNGSFGLNEKLQVIHELFDGSSELFYQAIQIFDSLPDFSQAKIVLSNYQQEFSWDLDNALLVEFVQKVARRYA
jgi:hypothetical protein